MKKTKEEVIREAWGSLDIKFPNELMIIAMKNDGYITNRDFLKFFGSEMLYIYDFEFKDSFGNTVVRPKSIQGIENNNGWFKIESEEDLPKDGHYFVVYKNGKMSDCPKDSEFEDDHYWMQHITHYQPIVKPKAPLY